MEIYSANKESLRVEAHSGLNLFEISTNPKLYLFITLNVYFNG